MNPIHLDKAFKEFTSNLASWMPEGIIDVSLPLLEEIGLLKHENFSEKQEIEQLPHYFHVIETNDKVTLFNHQFAIWIVPKILDKQPTTLVLIALINKKKPHLEIVFSTKGVYNTPKFVLKLIKHYLSEVIDTEQAISSLHKE